MTNPKPESPSSSEPDPGLIHRRIRSEEAGQRLDVYLNGQPEVASRGVAKLLIQAGQVTLGGRPGKPGQTVSPGDLVVFDPLVPEQAERPVVLPVPDPVILFEDGAILVIDKPAGLVCHPARVDLRDRRSSVAEWAEAYAPGLPRIAGDDRPGVVHRLDKETSGAMVLAKTEEAFHFLKGEFRSRRVAKEYRAIAFGESRFDSDFIERNIAPHPKKGDRMVVVKEGGREASTYYEVVERFAGFTHFLCRPRTGRTHQIRVHMTSVGHGLVGDRFYRSRNHASAVVPDGAPVPGRHCLHAGKIGFSHPLSREPVEFQAELPADLQELLEWLRAERAR